jgi:hypothetical protein
MGQLLLAVTMVAGTAACSVTSFALKGSSTTTRDDVYACAVRQLTAMNYDLDQENRDAGFVRGQKLTHGWWQRNYGLWGGNTYDDITVTVVDGQAGSPPAVEATGETYVAPGAAHSSGKSYKPPSYQVQIDVNALLSNCKVGDFKTPAMPTN